MEYEVEVWSLGPEAGNCYKNGKFSKYASIILSEFMTGREQNLTEYGILLHKTSSPWHLGSFFLPRPRKNCEGDLERTGTSYRLC